jgi:glyceraldehyde 3-phosphate dehydrogenase
MKGRLDGMSLRVPLPAGSITDFTAVVKGNPSVAEVNAAFAEAAAKPPLDRVLEYTEDPIVSSDIVGTPASCTFDAGLTMVQTINEQMSLVKVEGWYDNEWGYSNRLVDLTVLVGG